MVRVVGNRALALGDAVGGAAVTSKDLETGAVLASGVQTGLGGDLRSIMMTPRQQVEQIYSSKGSASFTATLNLTKPTLVEIAGEGPLKFPRAKRRASKTVLLYPGKHVNGDGIVLDINGLIVQIVSPTPDRPLGIGDGVTIRTTVNMMCDCIVEPFGNWDSRMMELYGEVRVDDTVIGHVEFFHQGPKGIFQGDYTIPKWLKGKDRLTLRVVASDAGSCVRGSAAAPVPPACGRCSRRAGPSLEFARRGIRGGQARFSSPATRSDMFHPSMTRDRQARFDRTLGTNGWEASPRCWVAPAHARAARRGGGPLPPSGRSTHQEAALLPRLACPHSLPRRRPGWRAVRRPPCGGTARPY